MREIKFRAWDKENKKMWYNVQKAYDNLGSFCKHNNIEDYDLLDICDCKDEEKYTNKMGSFDSVLDDKTLVVMQYTNLKDKNGKEIYEGDKLHNPNDKELYYEVFWDEKEGAWSLGDDGTNLAKYGLNEFWEVIGNIYENQELIK